MAPSGASQGSPISYCLWLCGLPNYIERICSSGLQPWEKFCPVTHLRPAAVCVLRHTGILASAFIAQAISPRPGFPLSFAAVVASGKPGHILFAALSLLVSFPFLTTGLVLFVSWP